ncbi:LOW QUALITY PROTEIN: replication factor C subunit 1-like [Rhagoletis pomonella]|uniref:LOW QUALITY PROTEIN: replication factor C subunit 1-like n=1 Tax=Rhagoletis pomonella TaxID=28610 RepID=UPI00177BB846|nr:LOW QUALITY PROTEIN: replication factor C subunit 1-like [Rhagoletis pomonella]
MQRDITSFFKRATPAKKVETANDDEEMQKSKLKKRTARVISSDEDEVPESPKAPQKTPASKKKRVEEKLPHERKTHVNKKPSLSKLKNQSPKKLKPIDPNSVFGGETLRVEAKKPPPPKIAAVIELDDEEIDKSLMEVDLEVSAQVEKNTNGRREDRRSKSKTPRKSPSRAKHTPKKEEKREKNIDKTKEPKKEKEHADDKPKKLEATPKTEKKKDKSTPKAKKQLSEDLESSVLSDEERHERKRLSAILYQKYKNRASVINPGSKEVPKGKPNCLAGLTFLVTGVLESLERDEAASIIKELGGKMSTTVGKRLNYLIVGEEAGPKKLVQAEEFGVNVISEDGLFNLIREKSGDVSDKETKNYISPDNIKVESTDLKKPNKQKLKVKEELKPTSPEKNRKPKKSPKVENVIKIEKKEHSEETECNVQFKQKVDDANLQWVDKYKPTSVKEIVGQFGPTSNVSKLTNWLSKWYINHDGKKKLQKPNPWAKNDDGSFYKAALLSGPPGIGKTTTAILVCKELGFDTVEFNASDTRSKRLLKEEVAELLSNKSLYGYFHGQGKEVTKKHVLIMDEVDGMAGNEDRGGIQELIALIKDSSVPIICMCNDRNHQKMRSLVNYCYDLRFSKPRTQQIKGRILSICCREGFDIDPDKVNEIIEATNNDIRQSINHISLLSAGKNLPSNSTKSACKTAEKDLKMGPWEVVRKVFSAEEHKHMTLNDKCDLFFQDYSLGPLFVQQNYLQVSPVGSKSEVPAKVALTADALSLGDLVDKRIRSDSAWSLLPTQAVFSSVMPGEYMSGHFTGQINFPGWLGKYSRTNKRNRLAQEIHDHTRLRTSASRQSIRLDYAPFLLAKIVRPLKDKGMEGVKDSLDVLKEYHLLREDIDSLIELTAWPGKKGLMDAVDGRVKAALTRSYNKEVLAYSYSVTAGVKKKKAEASEENELYTIEGEEEGNAAASDEEDDKIENDGLIKAKKSSATASSSKAKAGTSKGKTGSSAASKKTTSKASSTKAKK